MEDSTFIACPKDSDSRTKGYAGFPVATHPTIKAQRAYCFLCGAPAGYISQDSSSTVSPEHFIVTCDTCDHDIVAKCGDLPFEKIPTELFDAFGYKPEKPKEAA